MNILEIEENKKDFYREKLGKSLNCVLTKFDNEIFYILLFNNEEIGLRRIVYNLDEKFFKEYGLEKYIGKKIGFFTGTYIEEKYRKKGFGTKMFSIGLEKFIELKQDYIFSDARNTSVNIFLKNGFKKIGEIYSKEGVKETIVIKKIN